MKQIIIIGSGIGGLVAGNLLAKKGHKVTIFEAHSMPGGYTAGFYRKGYYFESGTLGFESTATVFRAMRDIGIMDRLEFIRLGMRVVSEDFDGNPANYEEFKQIIKSAYPSDNDELDSAFAEIDEINAALLGDTDFIIPGIASGMETVKSMLSTLTKLPKIMKVTRRYGSMTSKEFASSHFDRNSKLFRLFSNFSYPETSALLMSTAMGGVFDEVWTVKGGMQSWADALAENFRELGGELKLNSLVDGIITRNDAAVGVICKSVAYEADCVISAGDYKKTFLKLLDDKSLVPRTLQDRIEKAEVSEGFFTVYLGLDMATEELARRLKAYHACCFDSKSDCDIHNAADADYFSKANFYLHSPSMVDPDHAPSGKSSLMLQVRATHKWMDNWGAGDREVYRQLKQKAMDTVIERAAGLIPGLKECIEYKDAATPLTYERFTHNTGGASCAWSWNPNKGFFKDVIGVKVKTPVKDLYIGSSWAMQIGGVPGAIAAAYRCVREVG